MRSEIMLPPIKGVQFMPARQIGDFVTSSHLFTQPACSTLAKLVVHRLWSGDHRPFLGTLIMNRMVRVHETVTDIEADKDNPDIGRAVD